MPVHSDDTRRGILHPAAQACVRNLFHRDRALNLGSRVTLDMACCTARVTRVVCSRSNRWKRGCTDSREKKQA